MVLLPLLMPHQALDAASVYLCDDVVSNTHMAAAQCVFRAQVHTVMHWAQTCTHTWTRYIFDKCMWWATAECQEMRKCYHINFIQLLLLFCGDSFRSFISPNTPITYWKYMLGSRCCKHQQKQTNPYAHSAHPFCSDFVGQHKLQHCSS